MSSEANKSVWQKLESKAGYPYYLNTETGVESPDHPELTVLLESLHQYAHIKYSAYRTAFKTYELQKKLQVWSARISMGVLARHCLSISESSLTLEPCELEAVLADVHFACTRDQDGSSTVDACDAVPQLLLNVVLNMYHPERTSPVRVQAVKVLLLLLSDSSCEDKWTSLVETCADHNGCVSARRLTVLLQLVARTAQFLGEESLGPQHVQRDVDSCFAKNAGMLGMSTRAVVSWALGREAENGVGGSVHTRWLLALDRVWRSRMEVTPTVTRQCSACQGRLHQVLKFGCVKCADIIICERCYLYDKSLTMISGHKKTHTLHEITDGETLSRECLGGFIKDVKRLFACTKYRRKKMHTRCHPAPATAPEAKSCHIDGGEVARRKGGGKGMFTSTVGRAAGDGGGSPHALLQDIIAQLESQNRALKQLSTQLESGDNGGDSADDALRHRVDSHWGHIATQINRLKILKDNLSASFEDPKAPANHNAERMQAFDLFSPIPMLQEENIKTDKLKNQPRVLSLDSGNFSDASKPSHDSQLMTVSGDAIKPVVVHATSDSISTVSMNDISMWYGNGTETDSVAERKSHSGNFVKPVNKTRSDSICVTEQRYDADLHSVATSNFKMKELNADLDTVLDRLQQILTNNFILDDSCFDNTQLRETASEMEGLLGTLIRGVEERNTRQKSQRRDTSSAV